jgi:hypothetical protein
VLQKIAAAMPFWAFYVESKVGKTGLTVTVDVWEKALGAAASEIISGASATEVGDGFYTYELALASVDANGSYMAVFKTATTTVDAQHIPSAWFTPVWLTTVGGATVTFSNPVVTTSTLNWVPGDDYKAVDSRAYEPTYSGVPSLTGATVTMSLRLQGASTNAFTVTGSVLSATQLRFEPTSAQTLLLNPDSVYDYQVQALLSGTSNVTTLEEGTVTTLLNLPSP